MKRGNEKKPNCLSSAEIEAEGNYNMVGDGIINNVPKPSVLERMKEYDQKISEQNRTAEQRRNDEPAREER